MDFHHWAHWTDLVMIVIATGTDDSLSFQHWAHWTDLANIVIAIGTVALAIGLPLTLSISNRQESLSYYATLDATYTDIQKQIVEHPHLAMPYETGRSQEQLVQYDAFAFNVWNFIEAIYDYSETKRELLKTWECIIIYEAHLHGEWFKKAENHNHKFKEAFFDFIKKNDLVTGLPDFKGHQRDLIF
jgi:hypothetical protein